MINYRLISDAIEHYKSCGFRQIDTPWRVSKEIMEITRPEFVPKNSGYVVHSNNKTKELVASGEQSFLYLIMKGYLPDGKYQTTTPCFRNENHDVYHKKEFLKTELIIVNPVDVESELNNIISDAKSFFMKYIDSEKIKIKKVECHSIINYDIEINGVEVGSYGLRKFKHISWIYGTGIAEPRFSRVIKNEN